MKPRKPLRVRRLLPKAWIYLNERDFCVRYKGPLKHLRGLKALAFHDHPYNSCGQGLPVKYGVEIAVQFDLVTFRDPARMVAFFGQTEALQTGDPRCNSLPEEAYEGPMEGPNEIVLSSCWHVFPRAHFDIVPYRSHP